MPNFVKRFLEWFVVKEKIDNKEYKPPYFKEGEVWWCFTGENIGNEISGKGPMFKRPFIIIKKLDKYSFIGLPLTTKIKFGTWYVPLVIGERTNNIILPQVRYFSYKRLDKPLGSIKDESELIRIRKRFINLFK